MEPTMNVDAYVEARAAEEKELFAKLKTCQQIFDPVKGRFGRIIGFDPLGSESCDVEVVGSKAVFVKIPLLDLHPHHAFKFRAGQRIHVDGWTGRVKAIERKVKVKCASGRKMKFLVHEDTRGTSASYVSNGKLHTWLDHIADPQTEDVHSNVGRVSYPGSQISPDYAAELAESMNPDGCFSFFKFKNWYWQCAGAIQDGDHEVPAKIKRVGISKIEMDWEPTAEEDGISEGERDAMTTAEIIQRARVLGRFSHEKCVEGSFRMYTLNGTEMIMSKEDWLQEKIQAEGAPRGITVDEVDQSIVNREWRRKHGFKTGDKVPVKVLTKNRFVEVCWINDDGKIDYISLADAAKMMPQFSGEGEDSLSKETLYEIKIDSEDDAATAHTAGSGSMSISPLPASPTLNPPRYPPPAPPKDMQENFTDDTSSEGSSAEADKENNLRFSATSEPGSGNQTFLISRSVRSSLNPSNENEALASLLSSQSSYESENDNDLVLATNVNQAKSNDFPATSSPEAEKELFVACSSAEADMKNYSFPVTGSPAVDKENELLLEATSATLDNKIDSVQAAGLSGDLFPAASSTESPAKAATSSTETNKDFDFWNGVSLAELIEEKLKGIRLDDSGSWQHGGDAPGFPDVNIMAGKKQPDPDPAELISCSSSSSSL